VEFLTKAGTTGHWQFVSRKATPEPGPSPLQSDAAVIIPVHAETNKIVVIREFRVSLGDYEWSFPAGLPDGEEDMETVARRELKEETGLEVTKVIRISPPVVGSAGLSDETTTMIYVECTGEISDKGLEETEDIQAYLYDLTELRALLADDSRKKSVRLFTTGLMFDFAGRIAFPKERDVKP
jgi:ADP-ribose pyrophosphatase